MPYLATHLTFYRDIVDLYAPVGHVIDPTTKAAKDKSYDFNVPTFVGVKAYYTSAPEVDVADATGGRAKKIRLQNFDTFKFYVSDLPSEFENIAQAGREVADTWYLQLKTPTNPLYLKWFVVEGNPTRKLLMRYAQVFVRRTDIPNS